MLVSFSGLRHRILGRSSCLRPRFFLGCLHQRLGLFILFLGLFSCCLGLCICHLRIFNLSILDFCLPGTWSSRTAVDTRKDIIIRTISPIGIQLWQIDSPRSCCWLEFRSCCAQRSRGSRPRPGCLGLSSWYGLILGCISVDLTLSSWLTHNHECLR